MGRVRGLAWRGKGRECGGEGKAAAQGGGRAEGAKGRTGEGDHGEAAVLELRHGEALARLLVLSELERVKAEVARLARLQVSRPPVNRGLASGARRGGACAPGR